MKPIVRLFVPGTLCLAFLAAASSTPAADLALAIDSEGVRISSAAGEFVLAVPVLSMSEEDYEGQKPEVTVENGGTLVATYAAGMKLRIKTGEQAIQYEIERRPPTAKGLRFSMLVPISLSEGGKFSFDGQSPEDIPATQKEQMVQQGDFASFALTDVKGAGFRLGVPTSWQGLQDNRVFNWQTYEFKYLYDFGRYPAQDSFEIRVEAISPGS